MVLIGFYGLALVAVSLWLIVSPDMWITQSVRYCRWRWMHPTEIAIMIGSGVPFLIFAADAPLPTAFRVFGAMLVGVGMLLACVKPSHHGRMGVKMIPRFRWLYRPAGIVSLALGAYLVWVAVGSIVGSGG